ncbi:MAG: DUF2284 domain-containing protein [Bacillota bacterium]
MLSRLIEQALKKGASRAKIISTPDIAALDQVECGECPQYGHNLSCPPLIPPPYHFFSSLHLFDRGLLIQVDGPGIHHPEKLFSGSSKLHLLVLDLEKHLQGAGYANVKGLISGCCKLCLHCPPPGNSCRFPDRARSSMEAVGINVVDTCQMAGVPITFPAVKVTRWTGLLLFKSC